MFRIILPALLAFAVFAAGCGSTPASPEETGSVRVISSPPGAAVYPDSGNRSTTPATIPAIVAGTCTIGIRASG